MKTCIKKNPHLGNEPSLLLTCDNDPSAINSKWVEWYQAAYNATYNRAVMAAMLRINKHPEKRGICKDAA